MIGPSFAEELAEAGLAGLPVTWNDTEIVHIGEISADQRLSLFAVLAGHNPLKAPRSLIKQEAERRILRIVPEWKQRNLTARATVLVEKGRAAWTEEEAAEWAAGAALWARVEAIRAASDALEAAGATIDDVAKEESWPE